MGKSTYVKPPDHQICPFMGKLDVACNGGHPKNLAVSLESQPGHICAAWTGVVCKLIPLD